MRKSNIGKNELRQEKERLCVLTEEHIYTLEKDKTEERKEATMKSEKACENKKIYLEKLSKKKKTL